MGANTQFLAPAMRSYTDMTQHDWATTAATVCAASNNSSNKFCYRMRSNNLLNEACIPELSGDDASYRMASGLRWRERRKEQEAGKDGDIGRKKK